mmetsp:Transcript_11139/g.27375  ORF Transcript_11139/g.27375 Transcript_11139/m.27375 type:complete len:326 (+) Transcript_11139:291-1268(+)|eukprot:CAMPEP_0114524924 /NCGR_PEP_ID=MMETSP0109-20121206/22125_1 /TAXON_ID=29199 /ORGANISM="Chlorarachnion reptans, Strain CCCM449" /LENGTH=325 /DNA_ID=CAMNT_0001706421 /DNA_START=314 /DNA_END=1291 /DNA_ORIENTATION=+
MNEEKGIEGKEEEQFVNPGSGGGGTGDDRLATLARRLTVSGEAIGGNKGDCSGDNGKDLKGARPPLTKEEISSLKAKAKSAPSFVMFIGLPGSGKSTFRNALMQLNEKSWSEKKWQVVSQDDTGSRRTCESLIGRLSKDPNNRVILDRCNPDMEDRKYWLKLAWSPRDAAAVHFTTSTEVCIARIRKRKNHATIKSGTKIEKLVKIVRGFSKKLNPPTRKEGFARIYSISTPAEAADLLIAWGCEPSAMEWMREAEVDDQDTTIEPQYWQRFPSRNSQSAARTEPATNVKVGDRKEKKDRNGRGKKKSMSPRKRRSRSGSKGRMR